MTEGKDAMMIQVRRSHYRGQDGWKISGTLPGHGWPVSIFFEHESAARKVARSLRSDPKYRMTLADFEPVQ